MAQIKLGSKLVNDESMYFVADIGANHNGSLEKAKELIYMAKEAGADAAKFQNFKANKIVSKAGFDALKGKLSHQSKWKKSVFEIYQDASISDDWTPIIKETCDQAGIDYFTSPYDFESVDAVDPFLEVYKIGSGDISWLEIVEYIGRKNKPVLLATGAADMPDVERAMSVLSKVNQDIVLMQCNTNYTGSLENFKYVNLNVLKQFKKAYPNVVLGLSDHTPGHATVLGSIALGARVFEKHFTDDNNQEGPDHGFAMNPTTWRDMVDRSYELLSAMGDGIKRVEPNEVQSQVVQRRSLRAKTDLNEGHVLTSEDIIALRPIPEGALAPYDITLLIGKRITKSISAGEHFELSNIQ